MANVSVVLIITLLTGCLADSRRHPDIALSTTCDTCSIDVRTVWRSPEGDDNILGEGWPLEVGDTLWIMGELLGAAITRLPLDGGASTLFERKGDGPGEFRRIVAGQVHPSGDTIVIIQDHRVSFMTRGLEEVRSFANLVPRSKGFLMLPGGTLISANPHIGKPAAAAEYALHRTSPEGEYAGSFRPIDTPSRLGLWPMVLGRDSNTIWVVEPRSSGFVAELWDVERTERLKILHVEPPWWQGQTKTAEDYERMAGQKSAVLTLPTGTVGVWDSGHVLWIALRHFDAENPSVDFDDAAIHTWYDGVLLAVDRSTGRILATSVFDDFLLGFTNRGRLAFYNEDRKGQPRLRLAEVSLRGR